MVTKINDEVVNSLKIEWSTAADSSQPSVIDAPPEVRMLRDYINTSIWQSQIRFIFPGVLMHTGRLSNGVGFLFPEDMDPCDELFEGVMMIDPLDSIVISNGAFDRFMSRYFRVVLDFAEAIQLSVIHEEWWQDFVKATHQIEARVNAVS